MLTKLAWRVLRTADRRCLRKFAWNFGVMGARSLWLFRRRMKKGETFPPFLYLSIVNRCNLRCQGCWVDVDHPKTQIDLERMNRLINEAKAKGNRFFGLVGGEPFMHDALFEIIESHPECYFQVFTNGHFLTAEAAERLRHAGNATPLISIEGGEVVSDERRGGRGVLNKTLAGLDNSIAAGLLTGVATSVCRSNIDDLLNEQWVDRLIERGVHYVWYHTYRVIGPDPAPELALTREQMIRHRRFIVKLRRTRPIGVVDAYYNDRGEALCPAAVGISHHVGPGGDIEPCPIIQFARERIDDPRGIYRTMVDSQYLADFRDLARRTTRGCIVLERPELLADLVDRHGARDTTLRGTAMAELRALQPRPSHYRAGDEFAEEHWLYRLGKRILFSDFGVYDGIEHAPPPDHAPISPPSHAVALTRRGERVASDSAASRSHR